MRVLCLTGSIAMGKSTIAALFRHEGVPVFDADAEVHRLMGKGGAAVAAVATRFPGSLRGDAIDRRALGALVLDRRRELRALEAILHPLVGKARQAFIARARRQGRRLVVLDIPLLLETGGHRECDAVIVVSAPHRTQRRRILSRPGMTAAKMEAILARQMADARKRRHADHLIMTHRSLPETRAEVRRVIRRYDKRHCHA
jgi:dephospho-CoA kinase